MKPYRYQTGSRGLGAGLRRGLLLLCTWALLLTCAAAGEEQAEDPFYQHWEVQGDTLCVEEGVEYLGYVYSSDETIYEDMVNLDVSPVLEYLSYDYEAEGLSAPPSKLQLPSTLKLVGSDAFYYAYCIEELILPEGVETVLSLALENSGIKRVSLPSTVRLVEPGAFIDSSVETIDVSPDNPFYTSVDGVLYTKDKATLVAYPPGRHMQHVDVPAGVREIGPLVFCSDWSLKSITLPFGLERIGAFAFSDCVYLEAVTLPPTLRELELGAFQNCVLLERINVPRQAVAVNEDQPIPGNEVFENTTLLKDCWMKTPQQATGEALDDEEPVPFTDAQKEAGLTDATTPLYGIVDPENAYDMVDVYTSATGHSVKASLPCGYTVQVNGLSEGRYWVSWYNGTGYIPTEHLHVARTWEPLYSIVSAAPINERVTCYKRLVTYYRSDDSTILPDTNERYPYSDTLTNSRAEPVGQLFRSGHYDDNGFWYAYFSPSDLLLTRNDTHDGKTYGMVISDDPRNRLNLRTAPDRSSPSLGKYFSGTQLEILEEQGDWYRVCIDFQEGWVMKKFVRIVPVEPEADE